MSLAENRHKETQALAPGPATVGFGTDLLPLSLAFFPYCQKEEEGEGLEGGEELKEKRDKRR